MSESEKKLFVITGTSIKDTGKVSWSFTMKDGVPFDKFASYCGKFGWLLLRQKGKNEFNPFKLVRGEPDAIGNEGIKKWEVFIFEAGKGQIFTGSADETPEKESEEGLRSLIKDLPDCVLLMSRDLFARFEKVCMGFGNVTLGFHHHEGELETS